MPVHLHFDCTSVSQLLFEMRAFLTTTPVPVQEPSNFAPGAVSREEVKTANADFSAEVKAKAATVKKAAPKPVAEPKAELAEFNATDDSGLYEKVKDKVFEVSRTKGRVAAKGLLALFNVERITPENIKPEDYPSIIEEADKILAG